MRRFLAIVVVLLAALQGAKAQTPDNDAIFAKISDVTSPLYYPNILLRYKEGMAMSEEEYHYLYYGYAFQPSYKPLDTNAAMDRVQ